MTDMPLTATLTPSSAATNDKARERAIHEGLANLQVVPTSLIDFHSAGRLLILAQQGEAALQAAERLQGKLASTTLLLPPGERTGEGDPRIARAQLVSLSGYLGQFEVQVERDGKVSSLPSAMVGAEFFDMVLDLNPVPVLPHETPPLGYYPIGGVSSKLDAALEELPWLVGEFEKPKFFNYDPATCVHGRMGKSGCNRCIDACPTLAITSLGEQVEVNPHLCQGGGTCVSVCPSGAMSYAYPTAMDLLAGLRNTLAIYRDLGGTEPRLLFYGGECCRERVHEAVVKMPGNVFPVELEEIGSLGMDGWFSALAYGADQVLLYVPPDMPLTVREALNEQRGFAQALLRGMGYSDERLKVIAAADTEELLEELQHQPSFDAMKVADYRLANNKRQRVRDALEHLNALQDEPAIETALPAGAPFGQVQVVQQQCTLCHACVSICPVKALHADNESPKLLFTEANCVQCGLCKSACPETAISLNPRYIHDHDAATSAQLLHEEEPFHCVRCGKAFATAKMMEAMSSRLAGHWMFQDEAARRRLLMCDECRVIDMFEQGDGFQPHHRPG